MVSFKGNLFFIRIQKCRILITAEVIYGRKKHLKNTTGKVNPRNKRDHGIPTSVNKEMILSIVR